MSSRPHAAPSACRLLLLACLCFFAPASSARAAKTQTVGQGNWKIEVTYSGTAATSTGTASKNYWDAKVQGLAIGQNASLDLATVANSPASTTSGGVVGKIDAGLGVWIYAGKEQEKLYVTSGKMKFTLTWQPSNNDGVADPVPASVVVYYRRTVDVSANAAADSPGTATASLTATCDSLSLNALATHINTSHDPPAKSDPTWTWQRLTATNGVATKEFTVNIAATHDLDATGTYKATGGGGGSVSVNFNVSGVDVPISQGDGRAQGSDPSFTRWLPLAFSPLISSHPYRAAKGALPKPWGNIRCAYNIALNAEQDPYYFFDLTNVLVHYGATGIASDGSTFTRLISTTLDTTPNYSILDADGQRLSFFADLRGHTDVKATLARLTNGQYELRNAGPPGAMKARGRYTYTFETPNPGSVLALPTPGRLISVKDDLGNTHTLTYASSGNPFLTVSDSSSGRKLFFSTDAGGYLGAVDAPVYGSTTSVYVKTALLFDGNGRLSELKVYPGGSTTAVRADQFGYSGDALTSVSQNGVSVTNAYKNSPATDWFGNPIPRLASTTLGNSTDTSSSDGGVSIAGTYTYTFGTVELGYNYWGANTRVNTVTDPRGNKTSLFYTLGSTQTSNTLSGAIKAFEVTGPTFSGAGGANVTKWAYSPDANAPGTLSVTDPLLHKWTTSFDSFGNVTLLNDPLSQVWQFGYSADGLNLTRVTDPTLVEWTYNWGDGTSGKPFSRLSSVVDSAGVTQASLLYNTFGQPTQVSGPIANTTGTTTFDYHATAGDLLKVTGPDGSQATVNSYDALGDPLSFSVFPDTGNPATSLTPLTSTIVWDAAQQVTEVVLPNGMRALNTWNNRVATQTEARAPNGSTLSRMAFDYDSRGRLWRATDLVGVAAQYRYDKNSNLTRLLDGRGNATQFTFGPNDEPTGMTWPGGAAGASILYDAAGRVRSTTDERGIVANYVYDDADRLKTIELPATPARNLSYAYDAAGRLLTVTDASGNGATFAYNHPNKWLTGVTTTQNARTYSVGYTYYPDGRRQTMTSPVGTTSYAYDAAGRPASLTNAFGETTTWTYDYAGRLKSQFTSTGAGANIATDFTYGASGQTGDTSSAPVSLRQVSHSVSGQPRYTYDLVHSFLGQLLQQQGAGSGGESGSSETFAFGYDLRGRVTSDSAQVLAGGQNTTGGGTYSYDLSSNLQGGLNGWVYNAANQVTSAPALNGLAGATGLSYDSAGNLTGANGMTLGWSAWGELESVSGTSSGTVTFTYDVLGRRATKTVGGVTTHFVYDGAALIAETDASGSVLRSYTGGAAGLISDRAGASSRFYRFDPVGNTRALLDASGNIINRGAYSAYGAPLSTALTPSTSFGFQGQVGVYQDAETGLLLMRARYYAPALGRFVSRDPIGFAGGVNLYGYCGGDPLNLTDPSGLDADWANHDGGLNDPWGFKLAAQQQRSARIAVMMAFLAANQSVRDREIQYWDEVLPGAGEQFMAGIDAVKAGAEAAAFTLSASPAGDAAKPGAKAARANSQNVYGRRTASGGSPALKGDPYHPDSVQGRVRPRYVVNPAHERGIPGSSFNPQKTPLPPDAAAVYKRAARANMTTWFGKGKEGWYRYFDGEDGTAHFSGIVTEQRVPNWILKGQ